MLFSWLCAISGECIQDTHMADEIDVVLFVTPKGNIEERFYQGFGQFGSLDAFVWLAEYNHIPKTEKTRREDGKKATREQIQYPIKIVKKKYYKGQKYNELSESFPCNSHGENSID
jgi:hypothetical protein